MSLILNSNSSVDLASRMLGRRTRTIEATTERLSTGLRINDAADDAAGLGVATHLNARSISGRVAMRNANDAVSMLQTADGATDEVVNMLTRIRELAVESASESLASTERAYADAEVLELRAEIVRIAEETQFNDFKLTDGTVTQLGVQVGVHNRSADRMDIGFIDLTTTTLGVVDVSVATIGDANKAITLTDAALKLVSGERAQLGAYINRAESAYDTIQTYVQTTSGAVSKIQDADFAFETATLTATQILQQSAVSVLSQAKSMNESAIQLMSS